MPLSSRIAALRRNLFTQPRVERELDDELRAYLDQLAAEKRATGMDAAAAMRAARMELGRPGTSQGRSQTSEDRSNAGRVAA
jgi:hypothetical protein